MKNNNMLGNFFTNTFNDHGNEIIAAVALASFTNIFFKLVRKRTKLLRTSSLSCHLLQDIEPLDALGLEELSTIKIVFNDEEPQGKFLRGRHGVTHYVVDSPLDENPKKGLVVMSHGLGTSLKAFEILSKCLVKEGFTVLRYDFFGHGYSKANDLWIKYTPEVFADQVEDLIDHVIKNYSQKEVVGFVGHSTGGIVGVECMKRWSSVDNDRSVIPRLALISPAFWADKPIVAKLADKVPSNILTSLFKNISPLQSLVSDSYMEAGLVAFGRDPLTGDYNFKESKSKKEIDDSRMFGLVPSVKPHPFIIPSILGVNAYTLRGDILPRHRKKLLDILNASSTDESSNQMKVLFLWGSLDQTVPYSKYIKEAQKWKEKYDNLSIQSLEGLGHESPFENSFEMSHFLTSFLD